MNLIEYIAKLVGFDFNAASRNDVLQLRESIDEGRRHKRAEAFAQALASFDRALEQAQTAQDKPAEVIIHLHRADVMVKQKRWQEARALLDTLRHEAQTAKQEVQLAYILCGVGTLEQAVGDWAAARTAYEQAVEIARKAKSAGAEGRAMGHLADTYLEEGNASYAVHLLRETLPRLNMSGDVELSSYFVGRLGEALIETGHEQEGEQLLARALRLAEHMHYRAFERMWHLSTGRHLMNNGQFNAAYTHYQQAIALYPPDQPDYPDILREMSKLCLNTGRNHEALEVARRAVEIRPEDSRNQGALGAVLRTLGQSAEALPYLQAASGAEYDAAEGEILRSLAAAQLDTGDVDGAIITYERARKLAHQNEDPMEEARALRDLGQLYAQTSRLNDAVKTWQQALEIYSTIHQHSQIARLYCDIASVRSFTGQGARAMKDYEQALMALSSTDDLETRGIVLSNAATAYVDQGDIETAEAFFSEAIKIAQRLQDKVAEATRRGNYGWFLMATGRAQRALSAMEYALKLSEELNLSLQTAVQTDNMGLAYSELGNHAQAIIQHRKALEMMQGVNNPYWKSSCLTNLANALVKTGEIDEAAALAAEALSSARSLENANVIIRALTALGRVAVARGDHTGATTALSEAILIARRANARRLLAEALIVKSESSALSGEVNRARELWEEAHKLLEMLQHPAAKTPPAWITTGIN